MKWVIGQNCKCNDEDCSDIHLAMLTGEDGIKVFNSHLEAEAFAEGLEDNPENLLIMPQQESI
jgi:hypothetical protein